MIDLNQFQQRTSVQGLRMGEINGSTWIEQNPLKNSICALLARSRRHKIAWEFQNGEYTGRFSIDGQICRREETQMVELANTVQEFRGSYEFLSNMYSYPIPGRLLGHDGKQVVWPSSEHAYVACKCVRREDKFRLLDPDLADPREAKRFGRKVQIHPDWEEIKVRRMLEILRVKFAIPELRTKLLATGNLELIEGNWWGDRFWGRGYLVEINPPVLRVTIGGGEGQNWLGHLLMHVRREIREGRELSLVEIHK